MYTTYVIWYIQSKTALHVGNKEAFVMIFVKLSPQKQVIIN